MLPLFHYLENSCSQKSLPIIYIFHKNVREIDSSTRKLHKRIGVPIWVFITPHEIDCFGEIQNNLHHLFDLVNIGAN